MFWKIAGFITAIKLLLMPTYHSTDFEVHRNWLAITYSKPVKDWYYEEISQWTLDYPPLFAWFEFGLSHIAKFFDPEMLVISNLNYESQTTVFFQRLTVIISDLVFIYAVKQYATQCLPKQMKSSGFMLAILLVGNCGLLIVDHIHFQYNGLLYGILLLSLTRIIQGHIFAGAFWFALLLNMKHIYLYVAPAYGIYLLRNYVLANLTGGCRLFCRNFLNLTGLGLVVTAVFALSFGPFIAMKQLGQVLSRLFPFKRGLCHAYWAPNFWALYNGVDKALAVGGVKCGYLSKSMLPAASMTGGLVQEFQHSVLPGVPPIATLVCTGLSLLPCLVLLLWRPQGPQGFLRSVVLCAWGSFMFGWHVHEKAVLLMIIPLTLLAVERSRDARVFLLLATTGHFSLLPLIFTAPELPIKYCLFLAFSIASFACLGKIHGDSGSFCRLPLLSVLETLYLCGLCAVEGYSHVLHPVLGLQQTLPFLPLMLTSVYAAVGITYCWLRFYWNFLTSSEKTPDVNAKLKIN